MGENLHQDSQGEKWHRRDVKLSGVLRCCSLEREDKGGELHFWYHGYREALRNVSIMKHTNTLTVLDDAV